jgi:peroxiredoxin
MGFWTVSCSKHQIQLYNETLKHFEQDGMQKILCNINIHSTRVVISMTPNFHMAKFLFWGEMAIIG